MRSLAADELQLPLAAAERWSYASPFSCRARRASSSARISSRSVESRALLTAEGLCLNRIGEVERLGIDRLADRPLYFGEAPPRAGARDRRQHLWRHSWR